jgi:hypothetical protein
VVRRVVKPGPTGIFTTSTRALPHQFDTRTLTVPIADTPTQTRDVMRAHAAAVNGAHAERDFRAFIALQTWLETAGERTVVIPYAPALADIVSASHVRRADGSSPRWTTTATHGRCCSTCSKVP